MITVDNKFEIGEECYSVYREPIYYNYKCPICEGNGKFKHNGYDICCKNCDGTGKMQHNAAQTVLAVCKIQIRRMDAYICDKQTKISYHVTPVDYAVTNIKKRSESTIFKTEDDAEKYCVAVNTNEIKAEF